MTETELRISELIQVVLHKENPHGVRHPADFSLKRLSSSLGIAKRVKARELYLKLYAARKLIEEMINS